MRSGLLFGEYFLTIYANEVHEYANFDLETP